MQYNFNSINVNSPRLWDRSNERNAIRSQSNAAALNYRQQGANAIANGFENAGKSLDADIENKRKWEQMLEEQQYERERQAKADARQAAIDAQNDELYQRKIAEMDAQKSAKEQAIANVKKFGENLKNGNTNFKADWDKRFAEMENNLGIKKQELADTQKANKLAQAQVDELAKNPQVVNEEPSRAPSMARNKMLAKQADIVDTGALEKEIAGKEAELAQAQEQAKTAKNPYEFIQDPRFDLAYQQALATGDTSTLDAYFASMKADEMESYRRAYQESRDAKADANTERQLNALEAQNIDAKEKADKDAEIARLSKQYNTELGDLNPNMLAGKMTPEELKALKANKDEIDSRLKQLRTIYDWANENGDDKLRDLAGAYMMPYHAWRFPGGGYVF